MGPVPHLHRADRASAGGRDRVAPLGLLALLRRFAWLGPALRQPRTLVVFGLSALLLAGNWLPYAWAVDQDRVLDASLGYFITPLVNVLLGHAAHERSRPAQWAAVALAAAGVLWLALGAGHVPWVSLVLVLVLVLALSVGFYGLLRKIAPLGAIKGLALETLLLAPLAVGGLLWLGATGQGHFAQGDTRLDLRLLAAGPATAVPLLLASGAMRMADGGRRWPRWACCRPWGRRSSACSACSSTTNPCRPAGAPGSC